MRKNVPHAECVSEHTLTPKGRTGPKGAKPVLGGVAYSHTIFEKN
jgi:hypothetical protein